MSGYSGTGTNKCIVLDNYETQLEKIESVKLWLVWLVLHIIVVGYSETRSSECAWVIVFIVWIATISVTRHLCQNNSPFTLKWLVTFDWIYTPHTPSCSNQVAGHVLGFMFADYSLTGRVYSDCTVRSTYLFLPLSSKMTGMTFESHTTPCLDPSFFLTFWLFIDPTNFNLFVRHLPHLWQIQPPPFWLPVLHLLSAACCRYGRHTFHITAPVNFTSAGSTYYTQKKRGKWGYLWWNVRMATCLWLSGRWCWEVWLGGESVFPILRQRSLTAPMHFLLLRNARMKFVSNLSMLFFQYWCIYIYIYIYFVSTSQA